MPTAASSVPNQLSSDISIPSLPVSTSLASQVALPTLRLDEAGPSLEEAFLAAAAQTAGRKRTRTRTSYWPLWNHGDDDTVGHP